MRFSTMLRRFTEASGYFTGLYAAGFCTMPASSAACGSVRFAAEVEK